MSIDLLNLPMWLLDQVAYWANYKIQFTGPENFTVPLGIVGMMTASILLLVIYSIRELKQRK